MKTLNLILIFVGILAARALPDDYGKEQLRLIFGDRPMARAYPTSTGMRLIDVNDKPFAWAAERFTKKFDGKSFILAWDNSDTSSLNGQQETLGEHVPATLSTLGLLRVAKVYHQGAWKGHSIPFEGLWSIIIFELCNFQNSTEAADLNLLASEGLITETDYVERIVRMEYESLVAQETYYKEIWRPWAISVGLDSQPRYWRSPLPAYPKWRAQYSGEDEYPNVPYRRHYKQLRSDNNKYKIRKRFEDLLEMFRSDKKP